MSQFFILDGWIFWTDFMYFKMIKGKIGTISFVMAGILNQSSGPMGKIASRIVK